MELLPLQELAQRPPVPKMSICIMVAGTRGDVQPFIALGLGLKVTLPACAACSRAGLHSIRGACKRKDAVAGGYHSKTSRMKELAPQQD